MDLSFGNSSFSYPGAARAGGPSPARWAAGLATACLAVGLLLMVTAGEEGGWEGEGGWWDWGWG